MNTLVWILDKLGIISPNKWVGILLGLSSIFIAYASSDKWYAFIFFIASIAVALITFAEGLNSEAGVGIALGIWASFYTLPQFEQALTYMGIIDDGQTCINRRLEDIDGSTSLPDMDECLDKLKKIGL